MKHFYQIFMLLAFSACNDKVVELEKLSISENTKNEISSSSKELSIIFYFDGECSFCYANIKNIKTYFSDTTLILITHSKDTVLVNYNLDKIGGFKGKLHIDSTFLFYKKNEKILKENKLLLVNSDYKILDKSKFFLDDEVKESFKNTMINYYKN